MVVSHEAKEEAASDHPDWTQDSLRSYTREYFTGRMLRKFEMVP